VVFFEAGWAKAKNWLKPKIKPTIETILSKSLIHSVKALQNWKISVKALTKRLWKLTIKTKRLSQLK